MQLYPRISSCHCSSFTRKTALIIEFTPYYCSIYLLSLIITSCDLNESTAKLEQLQLGHARFCLHVTTYLEQPERAASRDHRMVPAGLEISTERCKGSHINVPRRCNKENERLRRFRKNSLRESTTSRSKRLGHLA